MVPARRMTNMTMTVRPNCKKSMNIVDGNAKPPVPKKSLFVVMIVIEERASVCAGAVS